MSKKKLSLNLIIINVLVILFVLPISVLNSFLKYQNATFFDIYKGDTSNLINKEILIITFSLAILTYIFFNYILNLRQNLPKLFLYPLLFVSIWIILSSFFFPLTSFSGIIDPASAGVDKDNLLVVIILSLILSTFLILKKKINIYIYFSYIFIFLNLSFLIIEIIKSNNKNVYDFKLNENEKYYKENKKKFIQSASLNKNKNIIVISIDGITSNILEDIFNEKPELKLIFKDFKFYENIFSQAPATTLSIAGELYGNLDFDKISQKDEELILKLNKLSNIYDEVEDTFTYGDYNVFNKNNDKTVENYLNYQTRSKKFNEISKIEKSIEVYRYSFSKFGTRVLVNYFDSIKFYLYKKFFNINIKNLKLNDQTFFHRGATFEKKKITDMTIIQNYIKNINVSNSKKSELALRMFHFSYSHFPVDFDENCNYFGYDKKKFRISQNYKSLKKETICSIIILGKFINKLKKLNLYDQTLLIFKSDHGAPSNYFNGSNLEKINYKINNHKQFGYLRYKPFLMIKNYNENYKEMRIINEFKSLNFLNFFYCNLIEKNKQNCKDSNKFQIFVPQNKRSTFIIRHLKKINIESKNDFINMIQN